MHGTNNNTNLCGTGNGSQSSECEQWFHVFIFTIFVKALREEKRKLRLNKDNKSSNSNNSEKVNSDGKSDSSENLVAKADQAKETGLDVRAAPSLL